MVQPYFVMVFLLFINKGWVLEVKVLEYRMSEGVLIIEPGAEIDHHQAEAIIRYTESLMRQRPVRVLIFDMEETVFMDSAGVGMMIGLYREMKMRGGAVGIIHMKKSVNRIYQMAGLPKIIHCYEDEYQMAMALKEKGGISHER